MAFLVSNTFLKSSNKFFIQTRHSLIDTDSAIIQSKKLYLGDKDADEPLLLGNQTVDLLDTLLESLKSFLNICETLTGTDPGIPLAPLNAIAVKINITIEKLQSDLKNITSKDNFTV